MRFGLCYLHIRNVGGNRWQRNGVCRIYRELELNRRIKPKMRMAPEKREALTVPYSIDQVWSMDFMHDQSSNGRSIRLFNMNDDFNREALRIEVEFRLVSELVIRSLWQIIGWHGCPAVFVVIIVLNTPVYPSKTGPPCVVSKLSISSRTICSRIRICSD